MPYFSHILDNLHRKEVFNILNFAKNMRVVGKKLHKTKLILHNLAHHTFSFGNDSFKYGKYTGYHSNIDTIYAKHGDVSLDFRKNHKKIAIVTGKGNDLVQIGDGKVSINMGQGDDILEVGNIGSESSFK